MCSLCWFSSKRITEFIRKYVKHAKLVEESTTELTYQLPAEAATLLRKPIHKTNKP
jgi:hypothetical protein